MFDTPNRIYDHNEYLNEDIFLRGIREFVKIIPAMAIYSNEISQSTTKIIS